MPRLLLSLCALVLCCSILLSPAVTGAQANIIGVATPTDTPTGTIIPTDTPTFAPSVTLTVTVPAETPTAIATATITSTATPSVTPIASATSTVTSTVAGDWPMYYHDLQRTGYNPDETLISASTVNRLTEAWQAYIGMGSSGLQAFSAPSVANGKVYVASSVDTGNNFFAFDTATGAPAWSSFIGFNPSECFGIGVGSTPAISGTLVTIGGGDGAYYGLSVSDGSQAWRHALDAGPGSFAWASPLVAKGHVYVGVASDCDTPQVRGEVRSLDLLTGNHIASAYMVPEGYLGASVWQSIAMSPDGSKIVAATGEDNGGYDGPYNRAIVVMDADTLDILAADKEGDPDLDQDWASTPIIFHDNTGRLMVGSANKNGIYYAYDLNNVSAGPVWSWAYSLQIGLPPVYDPTTGDGGTLYFSTQHYIWAIDPGTGNIRWHSNFVGKVLGGIAAANGLIFVNYLGTLKIISGADGTVLRVIDPPNDGGINTSGPVVSNGTVYWVGGVYLNAWHIVPVASCSIDFSDVQPGSTFYPYIHCLACAGVVNGYQDGTFHPNNSVTRGQTAKIVALSAAFTGDERSGGGSQAFQDVPPGSTFYSYTQQLATRGIIGGYACGSMAEPCVPPANLPYFRPNTNISRGQIAKIVAIAAGLRNPVGSQLFQDVPPGSTYYTYTEQLAALNVVNGYQCGGAYEPCVPPANLPYFRPGGTTTRGQLSKIVSLIFFPDCSQRRENGGG